MSSASALLASRWPTLYAQGLIAVEEASPALIRNREMAAARSRKMRDARKAARLCVRCGAGALPDRTLCAKHSARDLVRNQ